MWRPEANNFEGVRTDQSLNSKTSNETSCQHRHDAVSWTMNSGVGKQTMTLMGGHETQSFPDPSCWCGAAVSGGTHVQDCKSGQAFDQHLHVCSTSTNLAVTLSTNSPDGASLSLTTKDATVKCRHIIIDSADSAKELVNQILTNQAGSSMASSTPCSIPTCSKSLYWSPVTTLRHPRGWQQCSALKNEA